MSSIIDILLNNKDFTREKLSEKFKAQIKANVLGRVFNEFPLMLPQEQMQGLMHEFKNIIDNATVILNDNMPTLNIEDKKTKAALNNWFDHMSAATTMQLLDLSGNPSNDWMNFLNLNEKEREIIIAKTNFVLSSFSENIWGFAMLEYVNNTEDKTTSMNAALAVSNYANPTFSLDYFAKRQQDYADLCKNMMEEISIYKTSLDAKLEKMIKTLHSIVNTDPKKPITDEVDQLQSKFSALCKLINNFNRFTCGAINPDQLLAQLKLTLDAFKDDKAFKDTGLNFFKAAQNEPSLSDFIKKMDTFIQQFTSGKDLAALTASAHLPKPK